MRLGGGGELHLSVCTDVNNVLSLAGDDEKMGHKRTGCNNTNPKALNMTVSSPEHTVRVRF